MNTTRPPEAGPTRTGSLVALLVTTLAVVAAGFGVGVGAPAAAVAVGGALLWPAARWHVDDRRLRELVADAVGDDGPTVGDESAAASEVRDRTVASAAATATVRGGTFGLALTGVVLPVAYVWLFVGGVAETVVVTGGAVAVGAVALEAGVGFGAGTERWGVSDGLLSEATNPLLGLTVAAVTLGTVAVAVVAGGAALGEWILAVGVGPFTLAVLLQLAVLVLALLAPFVDRALSRLLGPDRFETPTLFDRLARRPEEVPRGFVAGLGLQLFLLWSGVGQPVWPGGVAAVVFGVVVPLLAVGTVALAAVVVGGWGLVEFVLAASGDDGPFVVETLAAILPTAIGTAAVVSLLSFSATAVGVVAVPLGIGLGTIGFRLSGHVLSSIARFGPFGDDAAGFGIASVVVVGVGMTAALTGAPPLAVYVPVAAALAAWYAGELAAGLGRGLGREAETAAGEAAHAVGLGVVLLAALAVVTALTYFVSVPTGLAGPRTTVAVVFLVVAAGAVALRETVAREWT